MPHSRSWPCEQQPHDAQAWCSTAHPWLQPPQVLVSQLSQLLPQPPHSVLQQLWPANRPFIPANKSHLRHSPHEPQACGAAGHAWPQLPPLQPHSALRQLWSANNPLTPANKSQVLAQPPQVAQL
jgi:hypothetical protein